MLLVIFILMTTASIQGMKVSLPDAINKNPTFAKPKTKSITVNREGRFFLDATPVASTADLETRLQALKSANPTMSVILRGDRDTQYQGIMDVLDVCGKLGLTDIGLVTQSTK